MLVPNSEEAHPKTSLMNIVADALSKKIELIATGLWSSSGGCSYYIYSWRDAARCYDIVIEDFSRCMEDSEILAVRWSSHH